MTCKKATGIQKGNVLLIGFSHFIHDFYTSILTPVSSVLVDNFHLTRLEYGILYAMNQFSHIISPLIGVLADKVQLRYFVILSPAVTCIAMSLLGIAPSYVMLAILLFTAGISSALFHVPTPVMMKKVAGSRTGYGMGVYMIGGEIARTITPLVIAWFLGKYTLDKTVFFIPFGLTASLILFIRLRNVKISQDYQQKARTGIKAVLKKHRSVFLVLAGFLFFRALLKTSLSAYIVIYFNKTLHYSLFWSNFSYFLFQLAGVIGALLFGYFSDKKGRKKILLLLVILTPVSMVLFLAGSGAVIFPALFIAGFFIISTTPVILAIVNSLDAGHPALMNSIFMLLSFSMTSISTIINGLLSDQIGMYNTYITVTVLSCFAIPFVWFLDGKKNA